MYSIKFGTDSWFGKMGTEFTFERVRLFIAAYAEYLIKTEGKLNDINIIISYDTRALSKRYSKIAAEILSHYHIFAHISDRDAPIGAIAKSLVVNDYTGAVVFTAGFKKPIYNGIKIINKKGAPAMPSQRALIEREIECLEQKGYKYNYIYPNKKFIKKIDLRSLYFQSLNDTVNFDLINNANLKIVVDNLYGTSRGYLDYFLLSKGIQVETIHNFPYIASSEVIPDCTKENLIELSQKVKNTQAIIGISSDIAGDRFGIVDSRGVYYSSNRIMPVLTEYLIREKGFSGGIVKSLATTAIIDKIAKYYNRELYESPIGFKHLANLMMGRDAFIGLDSSSGVALSSFVFNKDAILINLLIVEMVAFYGLGLKDILKGFYKRFPKYNFLESSLTKDNKRLENFHRLIKDKERIKKIFPCKKINFMDGVKIYMDESWLLIREAGTSNDIRIYAEADKMYRVREIIKKAKQLIICDK